MNVKELFKEAILSADWNGVCEVYTIFTNEKIRPPKVKVVPSGTTIDDILNQEIGFPKLDGFLDTSAETEEEFEEYENEEVDEEQDVMYTHECTACASVFCFEDDTNRKRCPNCKKHKLVPYLMAVPADKKKDENKDEFSQFYINHGQNKTGTKVVNVDGKKDAQVVPFSKNRIKANGTFVAAKPFIDNGTLESKDSIKKNPNLGVQVITPRGNREDETPVKFIKMTCGLCNKSEKIPASLSTGYKDGAENAYRCNSCCTRKGRRNKI